MAVESRPFAVVTGASTGIGYELARCCAEHGFELLIVADENAIHEAASSLKNGSVSVQALEADLATIEGVDLLCAKIGNRPVDALLANAGGFVQPSRTLLPRACLPNNIGRKPSQAARNPPASQGNLIRKLAAVSKLTADR